MVIFHGKLLSLIFLNNIIFIWRVCYSGTVFSVKCLRSSWLAKFVQFCDVYKQHCTWNPVPQRSGSQSSRFYLAYLKCWNCYIWKSKAIREAAKKSFFYWPGHQGLTPPLSLIGRATKKITFCGFPKLINENLNDIIRHHNNLIIPKVDPLGPPWTPLGYWVSQHYSRESQDATRMDPLESRTSLDTHWLLVVPALV